MPKGSRKKPRREDEAQAAVRVIREATKPEEVQEITPEMRAAAAAFGRIGGKIGGPARAKKLSANERSEIAKKAAVTRWKK